MHNPSTFILSEKFDDILPVYGGHCQFDILEAGCTQSYAGWYVLGVKIINQLNLKEVKICNRNQCSVIIIVNN